MLKRGYLNAEEKNFYIFTKSYIQMIDGLRSVSGKETKEIWIEWTNRGMMNSLMQKAIKTAATYLKKFCEELEKNITTDEKARMDRSLEKIEYRILDQYTRSKLDRDIKDKVKYAVIEMDKFLPILEDIAAVRCVGCKTPCKECAIYKCLEDIGVPFLGEQPNCPYAADLSQCTKAQLKEIESIKKKINGVNKVGKKYC